MRKSFLEKYPLHVVLFIFYFIFFLFTHNASSLPAAAIFRPLFAGIILAGIQFLFFYLIFRNGLKAGLATTLLNIPLLNYGILYDLMEKLYVRGYWPFSNIHRYLLIFCGLYVLFIIFLLFKKDLNLKFLTYLFNVFLLLMIGINTISFFSGSTKEPLPDTPNTSAAVTGRNTTLPDLYYIMMDGYGNQHILKKYYGFDNSAFMAFLKGKGFYVADSSVSNYYTTLLSLNSTLNMDYNYSLATTQRDLNHNRLFKDLKSQGYKIYNLESGYSVTSSLQNVDSVVTIPAPTEFERILLKYTVLKLDDLFGFLHYHRLKGQLKKIAILPEIAGGPKFFFIHFVSPHPPYVFNEHGGHIYGGNNNKSWEPKEKYIAQLQYFNSELQKFISKILEKNHNAAIVLQSDHGPWIRSASSDEVFEARSMILNAIRFPEAPDSLIYKKISSVNTFRFFKQTYFKDGTKLLRDSLAGKDFVYKAVLFKNLSEDETN